MVVDHREDLAEDFAARLAMVWAPPGVEMRTPRAWPLKRGRSSTWAIPWRWWWPTRGEAYDGAEDVIVEYDPKPAVVDPEKALEDGSPLVWESFGTNETHRGRSGWRPSTPRSPARDITVTRRLVNHRTSGAPSSRAVSSPAATG